MHEVVESTLSHTEPSDTIRAEGLHAVEKLLEHGVLRGDFIIILPALIIAGLQHRVREGLQLRTASKQTFHGLRVQRIVFRHHGGGDEPSSGFDHGLIDLGDRIPGPFVDEQRAAGRAFPPAGIMIEARDLVEAELFIIMRPDPFGAINRAAFQRRIDIAGANLLRHNAKPAQDIACKATHAEFQAAQILNRVDFLAEPTTHLAGRATKGEGPDAKRAVEFIDQFMATAIAEPGIILALIQAEGQARFKDEARVLAEMVIGRVLAAFHRAILHRIINLQGGHDFARGEDAELELAIRHFVDDFGKKLGPAEQRIKRFREGRGMAPADFRHGLGQRRCG